ncbi:molybdate ABC transporter substrate-binding protein [Thioalkalivibrio sp. ALE23]|uniref:molybdate ABC transporter substrate-binding protein n=1 Tax=Thioalkalivibrio sp. ALE23 TaxID=1265495 RepID=UPI000477705F|nr:molybdate ABC transporter substrate-binding protein [Thioalkalivibrio sp. ALE23]
MHLRALFLTLLLLLPGFAVAGDRADVAAAASLRFAFEELVDAYHQQEPDDTIRISFGASGRLTNQILNGAPFDLFFSADTGYPQRLYEAGHSGGEPVVFAVGRLALWSNRVDVSERPLESILDDDIRRVAIASPQHAPYGVAAMEAFEHLSIREALEPKLVTAQNVGQTLRMVQAGGADAGLVALSLAMHPDLAEHPYQVIDANLHKPLLKAFVTTRRGQDAPAAERFATFIHSGTGREILERHGFETPEAD